MPQGYLEAKRVRMHHMLSPWGNVVAAAAVVGTIQGSVASNSVISNQQQQTAKVAAVSAVVAAQIDSGQRKLQR